MAASISLGQRLPFVDTLGRVFSYANKLIFLNTRFEDHEPDPRVVQALHDFVDEHRLDGLHIRLNEYNPLDDLRRLLMNGRVNLLLRLFFGLPLWLATTLSVGRLFGGDHYNPWSDTVHLFSSHMGIALHETGHALDFRRRRVPGLYALTRYIPGVALYQEYLASRYAVEFMRARGMHEDELRALRILYPAYSTYVFGALVELFPSAGVRSFLFPAIALGHVLGVQHARKREAELANTLPQVPTQVPTVSAQWKEEWSEALAEVSPSTERGRDLWGVFLGLSAGSSLCGVGALPGAWLGYRLVRRNGAAQGSGTAPRATLP